MQQSVLYLGHSPNVWHVQARLRRELKTLDPTLRPLSAGTHGLKRAGLLKPYHAINGNFRCMNTFETESLLKQSYYYYSYVAVVVVDVVHIFNDLYHKGQAVSKYVAEKVV